MGLTGKVLAVNISEKRGEKKHNIKEALLKVGFGIEQDAHGGDWHRQVSLLSLSSVDKMRAMGVEIDYGDFAENITLEGINVCELPLGARIQVGEALLEMTQIGKECHNKACAIKKQVGDCVMPREGVFTRVLSGGWVRVGDQVEVLD
ncbi:MAG TPA: MOSC domain-containing protein [Syntrophomonadaceae bacterium]|nr:MOSC domain-containing protein [Syntrophomonadaceae bacterium]